MTNTRAPAARGDLHRERRGARAGAEHQDGLARLQAAAREERPPDREPRQRERSGVRERQPRRAWGRRWPPARAPARRTCRRRVRRGCGRTGRARADRRPSRARAASTTSSPSAMPLTPPAQRAHDPRAVRAGHERNRHARPAARDHAQIAPVERGRAQVDHDLAGPGHELCPLLDDERLRPSELAHYDCLRHSGPLRWTRRAYGSRPRRAAPMAPARTPSAACTIST